MTRALSILLCSIFSFSLLQAENWPRFRGPNGSGKSRATGVPLEWSESKNLKWKYDLPGPGSSSPIIWGDKVFVTCYSGYGHDGGSPSIMELKRHLIALNRDTGERLWEKTVEGVREEDPYFNFMEEHGYASNTPATDGELVFCFFGKAGVVAFDFEGNQLWKAPVGAMHSSKRWGSASSVVLFEDLVIVKAGDESRAVVAFDKFTGAEVWTAESGMFEQTYGTPVLHKVSEDRTDLIVAGVGEVWGMNPSSGGLRWFAKTNLLGNISSSPVISDDGSMMVLFGGFPRTLGIGLEIGKKGDVTDSAVIWENNDVKSYMTIPVFHEGKLYFVRDEGIACCADPKAGTILYEERLAHTQGRGGRGKPFYASPVLVDGHVLAVSRTAGTFVIEAKPKLNLVRTNFIEGDETRFQGTPAISDGKLFLRSEKAIYCIGHE
ncbi:MAG: PQQ-binding-like beta-propeller repeat protein [Verrucomicrobiales bacterium]|nr:PQQ-binding-like beta-propeller repeat protein [Verrucomicrobiales bacterium]